MAPRLKVFVTSDGLTDYVVAVSSKAKALDAWGLRQDVFKEGQAKEADDPVLVKAALAKPGEVLRRPAGTRGDLAKLKPARREAPKGPTKAQLKKVADLEARIARLDAQSETALADLRRREAALQAERAKLQSSTAKQRLRLDAQLTVARAALG